MLAGDALPELLPNKFVLIETKQVVAARMVPEIANAKERLALM